MFTEKEGITNKQHLIKTIAESSSLKPTIQYATKLVNNFFEHGIEVYQDGILAGYLLVFNIYGTRSLHGYKFIKGYGIKAFRSAKKMIDRFGVSVITTTSDQLKTIRLARLLGFNTVHQYGSLISFERGKV